MNIMLIPIFICLFSFLAYKKWSPILLGPVMALLLVFCCQLPVLDTEYTDKVIMHLLVPNDQVGRIQKVITEATSGRIKMEKEKELYFADVEGEIKVFDH